MERCGQRQLGVAFGRTLFFYRAMRFRNLIILFCMLLSLKTEAQELRTVSLEASPTRIMNGSLQRADLNGVTAALLIVRLPAEGVKFDGDLIGEPLFDVNEYYVWLETGCRMVQVKCPGVNSLMVHFEDLGIPALKSGQVYELTLELPASAYGTGGLSGRSGARGETARPAPENHTLRGKITDKKGEELIGASVVVERPNGHQDGRATDIDGNYVLENVPDGSIVRVSYVGYRTKEIRLTGKVPPVLDVTLDEAGGVLSSGMQRETLYYDPNDTSEYFDLKGNRLPARPVKKGTYLRIKDGKPEKLEIK